MNIQILSDLHLETEDFEPQAAPDADLLVIAGDVDSTWEGLSLFANWPVPVLYVPGNHEFDRRDVDEALIGLRDHARQLGLTLLSQDHIVLPAPDGRRIRFLGTTRWCDFNLFGEAHRAKPMRAASYFVNVMRATRYGLPFDPEAVRVEALQCRQWLQDTLSQPPTPDAPWDATVVITHFGPSLRSADPRYGRQPGTASFCNADDDLMPGVDLWLHGHLHCRHDYVVTHDRGRTRVVSNARGHGHKHESDGYDGLRCVRV
ncbi:MAG: metallophosphoesterase [Aquabacterium sp.]|uniref:metallophosphoesterase n=1 Tax=Aquabacterium sp. TaxID=1872578 RepID=UPI003BC6F787